MPPFVTIHFLVHPSEAVREYVDWFRVCSHPFLLPGEGPSVGFGAADSNSRVGYVSVSFYMFPLICFQNLNSANHHL